ncbi:hypothetical protein M431DRAFT_102639, partial [Trichoderma harzianum CBS 226.95]
NIKINRLSNKLNYKKVRPYKILKKISKVNYKLNLLKQLSKQGKPVHLIFYILLLKKTLINKNTKELIKNKIIIKGKKLKYKVNKIILLKIGKVTNKL